MASTKTWKHNGIKCTVCLLVTCDNRQCSCRSPTFEEAGQWYFNFTEWSVDRNPNLLGSKLEKGNTIVAHFLHWIDFWNDLRLIRPLAVIGICMTQSAVPRNGPICRNYIPVFSHRKLLSVYCPTVSSFTNSLNSSHPGLSFVSAAMCIAYT